MVRKKILVEGGINGRVRRTLILKQQDDRSRKRIIGELTSSNYTLRETMAKSNEEVARYRAENRN